MKTNAFQLGAAVAALALAALGTTAHAGAAWEFSSAGSSYNNNTWDFADAFTVNGDVEASGLGYYADPSNGQVHNNPVALYQCADVACDSTATLLASVIVDNTYAIQGHFRYVTISPITLHAGVGYEVAGVSFQDNYTWDDAGFVTDPMVNYPLNATRWQLLSSPNFLNYINFNEIVVDGFHGPNVFLGAPVFTGTPEPTTWAIMLVGVFGVGALARRRAKAAVA
jgi:hypothetical protein